MLLDERGAVVASWPFDVRTRADLSLVDELARVRLTARRAGYVLVLYDAPDELIELLDLVGLRVEMLGQPELGEQPCVEEVVVPDDPPV